MTSATDPAHFPAPALPEVAFLGRSNVGKSSLINSLLGTKIAKTSSSPGRTQSINFFEVRWAGKPQPELVFARPPQSCAIRECDGAAQLIRSDEIINELALGTPEAQPIFRCPLCRPGQKSSISKTDCAVNIFVVKAFTPSNPR